MGFKLIMAVSADGFIAEGPDDDMKWTGPTDKSIFKALTSTGGVLLVGARTAKAMPASLPHRRLLTLSRNGQLGITLAEAAWAHRDGWLIGGGTVAVEALKLNLVEKAYICHSKTYIGSGIPFAEVQGFLDASASGTWNIGDVRLEFFTGINQRGA